MANDNAQLEHSRRDWFDEAQKLEKRYCCLANDQLELVKELAGQHDLGVAQQRIPLGQLDAQGIELSYELFEKMASHIKRIDAALSASTEPNKPQLVERDARPRSCGCVSTCMKAPTSAEPSAPVERDEQAETTLSQVMRAYDYARSSPYLIGTSNWCAAVAHSLNEQARAALDKATEGASRE